MSVPIERPYQWSFRKLTIGGFNQRKGEALPPQIFLTLKFVVWVKLQNDENYRNYCHLMSDFKAKKAPNSISAGASAQIPLGELAALPISQLTPHPRSGPRNNLPPQICIPKSAYGGYTQFFSSILCKSCKLRLLWHRQVAVQAVASSVTSREMNQSSVYKKTSLQERCIKTVTEFTRTHSVCC